MRVVTINYTIEVHLHYGRSEHAVYRMEDCDMYTDDKADRLRLFEQFRDDRISIIAPSPENLAANIALYHATLTGRLQQIFECRVLWELIPLEDPHNKFNLVDDVQRSPMRITRPTEEELRTINTTLMHTCLLQKWLES